LLNLFFKV